MMQTNTILPFDVLDMLFPFLSCVLVLVNFLSGGFIMISLLLRCIVQYKQRGEKSPSYKGYFCFLFLALVCFGIGIGIFDLQFSSKLKCGALIVKELWNLVFSAVFFEASAFMFVMEIRKLCRKYHGGNHERATFD